MLKVFSKKDKKAIFDKLNFLCFNLSMIDNKKLKGYKNLYRIRHGNYRVVYCPDLESKKIRVALIDHKKDIYKSISSLDFN